MPLFVTIMHGGLPFAGQLALELGQRGQDIELDSLHATRYRGEQTGAVHWCGGIIRSVPCLVVV